MSTDLRRLAKCVLDRRVELRLTQEQVAQAGGLSETTVRHLEGGKLLRLRPLTLGGLDRGLQWVPGSAASVLAGGNPQPVENTHAPDSRPNDTPARITEAEVIERLDEIARQTEDLKRAMVRGRRGGPGPLAGAP